MHGFLFQGKQSLIDELNKKAENLTETADDYNKQEIKKKLEDFNEKWDSATGRIERRINAYSDLTEHWQAWQGTCAMLEKSLSQYEQLTRSLEYVGNIPLEKLKQLQETLTVSSFNPL